MNMVKKSLLLKDASALCMLTRQAVELAKMLT